MKVGENGMKHLIVISMCIMCCLCTACVGTMQTAHEDKEKIEESNGNSKPVIYITNPKKSEQGSITVVDEDGNKLFSYYGNIDIKNDGRDGNDIKIYAEIKE